MPFNGSGTWVPPAGQPVATGTVIQSSVHNTLVTDIGNTFNNTLPRDGQAPMSAPLKLVDGTSTIPGLSFNSEASTGLFRPSSGVMGITVLGVEGMRLNSSGRVLIGSTTDDGSNKLQVTGAAKVTGAFNASGAATLSSTLGVTGAATLSSTLGVTGATTLSSTLAVTGAITASGGLTGAITSSSVAITGGSINGTTVGATTRSTGAFTTLATTSNTTIGGTLGVTGATTLAALTATTGSFSSNTTISGTLGVTGDTSLSTLSTSGLATLNSLSVSGSSTVGAVAASSLTVSGAFAANGGATLGDASGDALTINSATVTIPNGLNLNGNVGFGVASDATARVRADSSNPTRGILAHIRNSASATQTGAQLLITQNAIADWTIGQPAGVSAFAVWQNRNSAVDGTERLRIDSSGNLGIGTSAPASRFHAEAAGAGTVAYFTAVGTTRTARVSLDANAAWIGNNAPLFGEGIYYQASTNWMRFFTNSTERLKIDNNGNVGIGADSAGPRLDVYGAGNAFSIRSSSGDHSYISIYPRTADTSIRGGYIGYASSGTTDLTLMNELAGDMVLATNNATRVRINSSGNVLVGTSTGVASGKGLAIFDSSVARIQLRNTTTGDTSTDGSSLFVSGSDFGIENREAGNMLLYTNGAERARFDSSGNFGVGVSPAARAHFAVSGTGAGTGDVISETIGANGNAGYAFRTNGVNRWSITTSGTDGSNSLRIRDENASAVRVTFDNIGNVGIGVAPGTWGSGYRAVVLGAQGANVFASTTASTVGLVSNGRNDGTNWRYTNSDTGGLFQITGNEHYWYTSVTGTAGNVMTFAERMRLDGSGNLGVGMTPTYKLDVAGTISSTGGYRTTVSGITTVLSADASGSYLEASGANNLRMYTNSTERMRVTSSGSVVVGATSNSGIGGGNDKLAVAGSLGLSGTQINMNSGANFELVNRSSGGGFQFFTNAGAQIPFSVESGAATNTLVVESDSTVTYAGTEIGYRNVPISSNSGTWALADSHRGKAISQGDSSTATVNGNTVAAGGVVTIYNNNTTNMTIAQGTSMTLRLAGTTTTGSRTLAPRGLATVFFVSLTEAIVSGAGVS